MYVRTNKGQIFDCIESEQMGKPIYYPKNSKTNGYIDYNEVYKKSNNIIDICEVGDYVNGSEVCKIYDNKHLENPVKEVFCMGKDGFEGELIYTNDDIKSIVTKEQFEAMQYKVGE